MSIEANKETIRAGLETTWNQRDWSFESGFYAPDLVVHAPHTDEPYHGEEGFAELGKLVLTGFPDYHLTVDDMIAEGDKVVVLFTWTGTNTGELMGLPPTGRSVVMHEINIYRMTPDAKVAEIWANQDMGKLMRQLGVIPDGPPPKLLLFLMKLRGRKSRASAGS